MNRFNKIIKNVLPYPLKKLIKKNILGHSIPEYLGNKYYCPVCNKGLKYFLPLQEEYFELAKKHGYIYSFDDGETFNYRQYLCPSCFSNDRDRLFALFYNKSLKSKKNITMLDFAPAWPIANFFRSQKNINYRTTDLYSEKVDDKGVNIADMNNYKDGQFNFFICSHVLEHVGHPDKALSELHRVLAKDGVGIILVPIITTLMDTQEDPDINTPELRWKFYGQDDHLRMFAKKDFIHRMENAGFIVNQLGVNYFGKKLFTKNGIGVKSILYCVNK